MKSRISRVILNKTNVPLFISVLCQIFHFFFAHCISIIIDKCVRPCIIRWINKYHLHLTQITLLQQLQHFQVVALNVEVFGAVPVHTFRRAGAQSLANRAVGLHDSGFLAHPGKLIGFIAFQNHVGQHLPQQFKVDRLFQLAVLALRLGHAGGEQGGELFDIGLGQVRGFHFQLVHFVLPPC